MILYNHMKIFECNLEFSVEAIRMRCISKESLFTDYVIIYLKIMTPPVIIYQEILTGSHYFKGVIFNRYARYVLFFIVQCVYIKFLKIVM